MLELGRCSVDFLFMASGCCCGIGISEALENHSQKERAISVCVTHVGSFGRVRLAAVCSQILDRLGPCHDYRAVMVGAGCVETRLSGAIKFEKKSDSGSLVETAKDGGFWRGKKR